MRHDCVPLCETMYVVVHVLLDITFIDVGHDMSNQGREEDISGTEHCEG
jgi:hypothetical protein